VERDGRYQKGGRRITKPVTRVPPEAVLEAPREPDSPAARSHDSSGVLFVNRFAGWAIACLLVALLVGVVYMALTFVTRAHQIEHLQEQLKETNRHLERVQLRLGEGRGAKVRLDWITDPHLDHLPGSEELVRFVQQLHSRDSDALLITGDIAEGPTVHDYLGIISGAYQRPVFFVLGNHDYYGDWMSSTHGRVRQVCAAVPPGILNWMPDAGVVMLSDGVALVGHGGMYDGQEGQPGLQMSMSDFFLPHGIMDMAQALSMGSRHLFDLLLKLGQTCAAHVRENVRQAARLGARRVIVLTHVPPFLEASHFRGRPSEPSHAPFYVNRSLGDTLLELSSELRDVRLEVLAGHTHGPRVYQAAENLVVRVGRARYRRQPTWQEPVLVGE